MHDFVEHPVELFVAALSGGLIVFAMCLLANWLVSSNLQAHIQTEQSLDELERNHEALVLTHLCG